MAIGGPRKQHIRRVSLGDMRHLISICERDIEPPQGFSPDFGEEFTPTNIVYAFIKTTKGVDLFDGTNVVKRYSHQFVIRYIGGLTEEKFIKYAGDIYNILEVESYDERNTFMSLYCNLRGDETLPVNLA